MHLLTKNKIFKINCNEKIVCLNYKIIRRTKFIKFLAKYLVILYKCSVYDEFHLFFEYQLTLNSLREVCYYYYY